MITTLSILSSIAVIVYSVITYAQYQLSKRQHRNVLILNQLNKQKDDFIAWFDEYLRLSHLYMRTSIALNMDLLEDIYFSADKQQTDNLLAAQWQERRARRITENTVKEDRYKADLEYQTMILKFVIDDRQPYFKATQTALKDYNDLRSQLRDEFSKNLHTELLSAMKNASTDEDYRAVMNEARLKARQLREAVGNATYALADQAKTDIHELEDEILKYV